MTPKKMINQRTTCSGSMPNDNNVNGDDNHNKHNAHNMPITAEEQTHKQSEYHNNNNNNNDKDLRMVATTATPAKTTRALHKPSQMTKALHKPSQNKSNAYAKQCFSCHAIPPTAILSADGGLQSGPMGHYPRQNEDRWSITNGKAAFWQSWPRAGAAQGAYAAVRQTEHNHSHKRRALSTSCSGSSSKMPFLKHLRSSCANSSNTKTTIPRSLYSVNVLIQCGYLEGGQSSSRRDCTIITLPWAYKPCAFVISPLGSLFNVG